MMIGKRINVERYRMGSSDAYEGDLVENHNRMIGGVWFDFSRVRWADGTVTVTAYRWNSVEVLHRWQGR